jgi:hypothetical protein
VPFSDHLAEKTVEDISDTESEDGKTETVDSKPVARPRKGLAFAGAVAVLAAIAGLVLYGVLTPEDQQERSAQPSAEVTYEVEGTGTVDVSYRSLGATGNSDHAVTATKIHLPWKKSVQVPLGKDPVVSITLDEEGGLARCSLAISGKHIQSGTATGEFGRATCSGALPAPESGMG